MVSYMGKVEMINLHHFLKNLLVDKCLKSLFQLLNVDYNIGPLRTEENMYLAAPPHVARDFPEQLQRLVGYTMSGTSFGYFGEYQHPREALAPHGVVAPSSSELHL